MFLMKVYLLGFFFQYQYKIYFVCSYNRVHYKNITGPQWQRLTVMQTEKTSLYMQDP